jgi:catechol 2,3-dioxygenase-like lactoylglutathione lyase family enzyme
VHLVNKEKHNLSQGKTVRTNMKHIARILILGLLASFSCKKLSQPEVRHFNPGDYLQISLSVTDLDSSLRFYQKLGFKEIKVSESSSVPWALMTDGWKMFMISQNPYPSPALTYYSKDLSWRIDSLKAENIPFEDVTNALNPSRTLVIKDPSNMGITLIQLDVNKLPTPDDSSFTILGKFAEISIPVNDLAASLHYYTRFGFSIIASGDAPLPWAKVSDQNLTLGFYETDLITGIAFTYDSMDMEKTTTELKKAGIPIFQVTEIPGIFKFGFSTPDGQIFYVRGKSGK